MNTKERRHKKVYLCNTCIWRLRPRDHEFEVRLDYKDPCGLTPEWAVLWFGILFSRVKPQQWLPGSDGCFGGISQHGGGSSHGKCSADGALETEGSHVQEQGSLVLEVIGSRCAPM